MSPWTRKFSLEDLDAIGEGTASENFGICFTAIGEDWIAATIPLDARTRNSDGTLHPGALGILAETIGSVAASLCIDTSRRICVGQILHVNHPVLLTTGPVYATASLITILNDSHVWNIEINDPTGAVVGAARLAVAILDRTDL
jgi:uncharacterized protein (TIGR00369 family)